MLGTLQSIGSAARIVGPPVLGALADTGGFAAAFGLSALAGAAAGGVAARWKGYFGTLKILPHRMSEKNGSGRQLLPLKL